MLTHSAYGSGVIVIGFQLHLKISMIKLGSVCTSRGLKWIFYFVSMNGCVTY